MAGNRWTEQLLLLVQSINQFILLINVVLCSGSFGPSLLLIGLSFLDCTQTALAVTILTIAVSLSGCLFSGYFVNHMDIAPQYAGTLMGISNAVAASSGFIAPYVASVLTRDVSLSGILVN